MLKRKYMAVIALAIVSVLLGGLFYNNMIKAEIPLLHTFPGALYTYTEKETYTPNRPVELIMINFGAYETNITLLYVVRLTPPTEIVRIIEPPENHLKPLDPSTMQFDSMTILWDQKDANGDRVPSGHYIFWIQYSGPPDWETLYALSSRFYVK